MQGGLEGNLKEVWPQALLTPFWGPEQQPPEPQSLIPPQPHPRIQVTLSASLEKEKAWGQEQLTREEKLQGEKEQSQGSMEGDWEGWVRQ